MPTNNNNTRSRRRKRLQASLFWMCVIPSIVFLTVYALLDNNSHHQSYKDSLLFGVGVVDEKRKSKLENSIAKRRQERSDQRRRKYLGRREEFGQKQLIPQSVETFDDFDFDYSQKVVRTNDTLPDPQIYHNETTILIVLSARQNHYRRSIIRRTWGKNHPVYFVIGGKSTAKENNNAEIQKTLLQEHQQHHDLLDSIHPDHYRSLPFKLRFAYQWILQHVPTARWFVKVDDDTVVRVDTLESALLRNLNSDIPMVVGRIIVESPVHKEGKWAELKYTKSDKYPYWPQGSCGHIVSRPIAQYVTEKSNLVYYQGEDTSLGIWLDESPLHITWLHSLYFVNHANCMETQWLIVGHQVTPEQMQQCYRNKDEWHDEDVRHRHKNLLYVETHHQRQANMYNFPLA